MSRFRILTHSLLYVRIGQMPGAATVAEGYMVTPEPIPNHASGAAENLFSSTYSRPSECVEDSLTPLFHQFSQQMSAHTFQQPCVGQLESSCFRWCPEVGHPHFAEVFYHFPVKAF